MKQNQQIFLLGISQRCGTNFLMKVLEKHPDIFKSSHPGEDFIIQNSNYLLKHTTEIKKCWSNQWKGMDNEVYSQKYLNIISNSLIDYLAPEIELKEHQYCISKTPSVENINNVFKLFPQSKLIILVRNGKNIIESGVKGFGWSYSQAMKMIKHRSELIIEFIEENKNNPNFIVVRYEDLIEDLEKTTKNIFDKLSINDEFFDYSCIKDLPIYGSSFIRDSKNKLTWKPQTKNEKFSQLIRSESWSYFLNKKYDLICGKASKYFYK